MCMCSKLCLFQSSKSLIRNGRFTRTSSICYSEVRQLVSCWHFYMLFVLQHSEENK